MLWTGIEKLLPNASLNVGRLIGPTPSQQNIVENEPMSFPVYFAITRARFSSAMCVWIKHGEKRQVFICASRQGMPAVAVENVAPR